MDFYKIKESEGIKKGVLEIFPDFQVATSQDLMTRGRQFYAVWNPDTGLWSTNEYDVPRLVDKDITAYVPQDQSKYIEVKRKTLGNFSTNAWLQFRNFIGHISDSYVPLDEKLTFSDTVVTKEDYVSHRLSYPLKPGDISAWDELVGTLYNPVERAKIEWSIGCIVSGDSKTMQKFLVFYGKAGTGKSTIISIIEKLFEGYISRFDAKALTSNNNQFATEVFKNNPLVAIQHDTDLSKIEDNSKLNSIVSHEVMTVNEKHKSQYDMRFIAFLIIGSNKAVKISDAKSGLLRRLIDIHPTEQLIAPRRYQTLMAQIEFELGAIASHCLNVYREMGKNYYESYRPTEMMLQTDVFYNFIEAEWDIFSRQDGITLKQAYSLYKNWCSETGIDPKFVMPQYKFRPEFDNYFDNFDDRYEMGDGTRVRSWYSGFNADRFKSQNTKDEQVFSLVMDETESLFDSMMKNKPAQYSKADGFPRYFWTNKPKVDKNGKEFIPKDTQVVQTKLRELDTTKEHYVKVPLNHIVIDFDLEDEYGAKSLQKNLEAASQWPATYAELSRSEHGVHLHYIYEGDPEELSRIYEPGIEIKVFTGDTSLRRKLSKCNNVPVASINSGLPIREKKVDNGDVLKNEKHLRDLIMKALRKEIHESTKPNMDFIDKILRDAYSSGMVYDVTDMRPKILLFATGSSHQALYCMKLVQNMAFASEKNSEEVNSDAGPAFTKKKDDSSAEITFFDVEVFPNLVVVCYKHKGAKSIVRLVNPTSQQIEEMLPMKLVGFNNRRYDNHILYALFQGLSVEAVYKLSQRLINNSPNATYGEAYNISYTDIYEFASEKKSLKQWEIELGIKHLELGLPWDQPVPESLWEKVVDYCCNDVLATEEVFDARKGDFIARQILADLSGMSINATTQQHASKIIFGDDRRPQEQFIYTNLSHQFPGYEFDLGKSTYKGETVGEGGYVYAEPGIYENVAVLDVASMHPTSIEELELFGGYTKNFSALKNARISIKRKDWELARTLLDGKLEKYIPENPDAEDSEEAENLSYALKIVINIVYGLTAARFDNSFKDPRNIDNIVAKRGALFMINLKHMVQELGFQVIHIKTDSIKIPNATKAIIDAVMEYGLEYGYEFEHEATYTKMALVNDAVYIAKVAAGRKPEHWEAVGAQFAHPYVFKTLFSHDKITFKDKCESKQVTTALYLDFTDEQEAMALAKEGPLHFVGKTGEFCPIQKGKGGARLMREKDGKFYAATGTKGYYWLESDMVKTLEKEKDIDLSYFEKLAEDAKKNISRFGDFEVFVS